MKKSTIAIYENSTGSNLGFVTEIWESNSNWQFKESTDKDKSVVDGIAILGIVEGQFFVPDGKSRNERFYPRSLWESVLGSTSIKEKLSTLTMYGMIGHEDRSISEEELRSGQVSHIVADLWIDEQGRGMGRAYILGTESGKNLYIYLKAGSKLKTSSRARGKFSEKKQNGLPVVDTDSFYLETFDFVINPGFIETSANLQEKLNKNGGTVMADDVQSVIGSITEQSEKLQNEIKHSLTENARLKIENDNLINENAKLSTYSFLSKVDASIVEALTELDSNDWNSIFSKINITGELRDTTHVYEGVQYDAVYIPVKSSKVPLDKFQSVVRKTINEWDTKSQPIKSIFVKKSESYNSNGLMVLWKSGQKPMNACESIEKLVIQPNHDLFEGYGVPLTKSFTREQEEMLESNLIELDNYRKLGTVDELNKAIELSTSKIQEYLELGSVDEISEGLDKLTSIVKEQKEIINSYKELGSVDEINDILDRVVSMNTELKSYKELGSIDEIKTLTNVVEGLMSDNKDDLLKQYVSIGSPEDIVSVINSAETVLESYLEIGTVSEIQTTLDKVEKVILEYKELGSPSEIDQAIDKSVEVITAYQELGTPEQISEALDRVSEFFESVGNPEQVNKALDKSYEILESYKNIGSPNEINETLDTVTHFFETVGSPEEIIESLEKSSAKLKQYMKLGSVEEIMEVLSITESLVKNKPEVKSKTNSPFKKDFTEKTIQKPKQVLNENTDVQKPLIESPINESDVKKSKANDLFARMSNINVNLRG